VPYKSEGAPIGDRKRPRESSSSIDGQVDTECCPCRDGQKVGKKLRMVPLGCKLQRRKSFGGNRTVNKRTFQKGTMVKTWHEKNTMRDECVNPLYTTQSALLSALHGFNRRNRLNTIQSTKHNSIDLQGLKITYYEDGVEDEDS
jgi:hypothetical protein